MTFVQDMIPILLIGTLTGISFAGLAYFGLQAFFKGADEYSGEYSKTTAREFEDLFLFISPKRITEISFALAGTAFILVFGLTGNFSSEKGIFFGMLLGTAAAGGAMFIPKQALKIMKANRLKKFNLQLVDTLITMSNALKAGFSISQAIEAVVREGEKPISQEFELFLQETRVGVSFSDAMFNLEKRVQSEDLTLVVMAIDTARKTGGNLTDIFDKIAHTIRERMRIENRIQTLTAQGKMQGFIVGSMPVVIGIALTILDPDLMKPFFCSPVGFISIFAVAVLLFLGGVTIKRIININV